MITLQSGSGYKIYRRLLERDEYANGSSQSARILFTATGSASGLDGLHLARPGTLTQVDFENSSGGLLRRENHYFYTDPSSTAPPPTDETTFAAWWWGLEFKTEIGDGSTIPQTVQNVYGQRPCNGGEDCWFGDPNSETTPAHDIQVCQTNTVLDTGAFSSLILQYDQNNNVLNKWEYDFGPAPGIAASCPSVAPAPTGWTRVTTNTYKIDSAYLSANLVSLPSSTAVNPTSGNFGNVSYAYDEGTRSDAPGIVGHDAAYGTAYSVRGNPTTISRSSSSQGLIKTTLTYDIAGNVKSITDQKTHATTMVYSDPNNTYAHPTQQTNALTQVTTAQYDLGTGKITSVTDPNSVTTTYAYNDPLDRPTQVIAASGTSVETRTTFTYTGTTQVTQKQDQVTTGDGALRTDMFYDKLGRLTETRNYETLSQYISTTQSYDALGRIATSTNPSRPGDGLGYTTTYSYDSLGRQIQIQTPDNALTTTSYSGNQTTVTDPAGKVRQTYTDGLGRLTLVTEDPGTTPHLNYSTSYTYDVLDNLKTVTQGAQTRTFNYDNLGWLSSAVQPESGTISYLYDGVGNLTQRTDARGIQTTYTYDALNRISGKTYTDSTPSVTYTYDNLTNSKGRLTKVVNANSTTNYSAFDPLGRVTGSNQVIGGITYPFSYVYNRASAVTSETYPTGRVITTNYDGANRPSSLSGTLSGVPRTYASPISYTPHGAISSATLGNSISQSEQFNSRLEPTQIVAGSLLTLGYGYGTTSNNGNPVSQTIARPGVSTSLAYGYDGVNRLQSATQTGTTAWSQNYGFDNFGNRWLSSYAGLPAPTAEVPQTSAWYGTNNRISSWSYDLAGNILSISGMTRTFTYDAENLQKTAAVNGTTTTYLYDGDGHRVKKTVGAGTPTVYIYDAMGNLALEYGLPFDVGTKYLTADSLGSTRLVTKADGTVDRTYDYLPFGQEIGATYPSAPSGPSQKFTGKERDAESGLDFFGGRYMSAPQGRFTSIDPSFESELLEYPQTWNRYSYVYNNPLRFTDPDGRCPTCPAAAIGAGIGGLAAGGINLYSQLGSNGWNVNGISWSEVGANAAGGAVTGGLAGLTLGGSLLVDVAVGAGASAAGGFVTRAIASMTYDATADPYSGTEVAIDLVAGGAGGAIGNRVAHRAADLIHAPEVGPYPRKGRNFGNRLSAYNIRKAAAQTQRVASFAIGTAVSAIPTAAIGSVISNGFWNSLDWLINSIPAWPSQTPQPTPPNLNTSEVTGCWDMQGNSCD